MKGCTEVHKFFECQTPNVHIFCWLTTKRKTLDLWLFHLILNLSCLWLAAALYSSMDLSSLPIFLTFSMPQLTGTHLFVNDPCDQQEDTLYCV